MNLLGRTRLYIGITILCLEDMCERKLLYCAQSAGRILPFSNVKQLSVLLSVCMVVAVLSACGGSIGANNEQAPDPVAVDVPIAYVKRDLTLAGSTGIRSLERPALFMPGAVLMLKARANTSALEADISSSAFAHIVDDDGNPLPYDVKDIDSDYTGTRLIFAMRSAHTQSMTQVPTWNIWEYDRSTRTLRRIINSNLVADEGEDTGPTYLADGRIVFSSTRQRGNQARLLDEGKPQYAGLEEGRKVAASVLHVMNADGTQIKQISFNQSHDFDPVVLPNGKILFSRWDQVAGNKGINLYQINADGSDLELRYGRHSHQSVVGVDNIQYAATSITPEGRVLAAISSFGEVPLNRRFLAIDIDNYIDNQSPVASMPSLTEFAQQSVLFEHVEIVNEISPNGYITALYPLWDGSGRILFSWNQCRLLAPLAAGADPAGARTIAACSGQTITNNDYTRAPDLYGLWMFTPASDAAQATQLPLDLASETEVVSEIVALESRPYPNNPSSNVDRQQTTLINDKYGVLHIRSVYDYDGHDVSTNGLVNMANPLAVDVDSLPARFLRVVKNVSIPNDDTLDFDNAIFGRSRSQLFREIAGYTPIQPDGSVKVAIPAGVPFAISIVDASGKRISTRHNNWLQLASGEQKNCIGCHESNSSAPHGRVDAQPSSINAGASSTGVPFPNTNPALNAQSGETMAETYARILGVPRLTANVQFKDVWTDEAIQIPAAEFSYAYQDLDTPLPITQSCAQNWTALCRSVINYPQHIAPLWELSRQTFDNNFNLMHDNTCIGCHSQTDDSATLRVPLAHLDLASELAGNSQMAISYRELMFDDVQQEVVEGVLRDKLVPVIDGNGDIVYLRNEENEQVLDVEGKPIAVTRNISVSASMHTNGAHASARFFRSFEGEGSHAGMLSKAELRLIAEWLDIGGQYYNNPFDVPQD